MHNRYQPTRREQIIIDDENKYNQLLESIPKSVRLRENKDVFPFDENNNWLNKAACKGVNPNLFFADLDQNESTMLQDAHNICAKCDVPIQCLIDAINCMDKGIRAGTTTRQRQTIKIKFKNISHQIEKQI